jgi:hypothetical protein
MGDSGAVPRQGQGNKEFVAELHDAGECGA